MYSNNSELIKFLSDKEVGEQFTSKDLIFAVGGYETSTYWKRSNNNVTRC